MNEQDPLSTYSLWAKQASILEDQDEGDSTQTIKPNGAMNQKENMDERRRQYGSKGRGDSGYGGPPAKVVQKKGMTRRRLVPSSDDEDAIVVSLFISLLHTNGFDQANDCAGIARPFGSTNIHGEAAG